MEDLHRELLRRRQKYLQENVIMEDGLLTALQEKGVFTSSMVASIQVNITLEKLIHSQGSSHVTLGPILILCS